MEEAVEDDFVPNTETAQKELTRCINDHTGRLKMKLVSHSSAPVDNGIFLAHTLIFEGKD
tara:strand:- start:216 stop:395 length:180 start_codon:yes stop_codon:yes gene_type:complete